MATGRRYAVAKRASNAREAPAWTVTFADMMSQLLCFFVVLFSMATVEKTRFAGLAASMAAAFSAMPDAEPSQRTPVRNEVGRGSLLPMPGTPGRRTPTPDVGNDRGSLGQGGLQEQAGEPSAARKLVEAAGLDEFAGLVHVEEDASFLKVRLPGDLTFKPGRAELSDAAGAGGDVGEVLGRVAMVLRWIPNDVIVIGHTDDLPSHGTQFPSNWELSAARAGSVVRHLSERLQVDAARFTVVGKGSTEPLVVSLGAAARARNRRVELWVHKDAGGGDPLEPR